MYVERSSFADYLGGTVTAGGQTVQPPAADGYAY